MNVSSFFNYSEPLNETTQGTAAVVLDFSLLSGWSTDYWNTLLELTQTLRFDSGDIVFQQGDTDRAIYLVAAGQFELALPRPSGPLRIATADLGTVVGEQGFLDGQPHAFTAQAVTDGELVRFALSNYESFNARHPDLANQLIWDLARIVSLRQRQIASLLAE